MSEPHVPILSPEELLPKVQSILSTLFRHFLQKICSLMAQSDWQGSVKEELSSSGIIVFSGRVKGEGRVQGPGKNSMREVLGCCSFSLRSLVVYIADLHQWLVIQSNLQGKTPSSPFASEMDCISFAESILDAHKCNKDIADASEPLRKLGSYTVSGVRIWDFII